MDRQIDRDKEFFQNLKYLPVDLSVAMHTVPVDPSPIFIKLSKFSRGSPAETTI